MSATFRIEKHKGFTLVVQEGWLSVVLDSTGDTFEGPVDSDDEVKAKVAIVIPVLKSLTKSSA